MPLITKYVHIHCASNHPPCWDHGLHVHKPRYFPPNRALKMRESQQLFLRLRLVSKENQQSAIQTKIEQHFGGFFQQIKGRQPIGRKDSKHTVIPTSRRLDSILYKVAQIFELISNSRSILKNKKHIAVDVLFKMLVQNAPYPFSSCRLKHPLMISSLIILNF
jgi:hypothetical protein